MHLALNDILALVGRLDDAPGFDTPRERFRRFLFERVPDAAALRSLVEEGQYALGDQHRRALQDALVVAGRFLGFETSFGSYERIAGALKFDGLWRSRHRVEITLDIRANEAAEKPADLGDLARSLAALPPFSRRDTDVRRLGLCIATPLYGDRARLDDALAAQNRSADIRIVSIRSLLWLMDAAGAGRLRHDEIVRLLTTAEDIDFLVDLMARTTAGAPLEVEPPPEFEKATLVPHPASAPAAVVPPQPSPVPPVPPTRSPDASYWLITVEPDDATTPEQFVTSVIGTRQLLGIRSGSASERPHPGDWICFSIRGKGIAGHAQVDAMADAPPPLRDAHRFSAVFVLKNVDVYSAPLALGPDAGADRAADRLPEGAESPLISLSAEEFAALTAHDAESRTDLRSAS